jgi:hypothetical protein
MPAGRTVTFNSHSGSLKATRNLNLTQAGPPVPLIGTGIWQMSSF